MRLLVPYLHCDFTRNLGTTVDNTFKPSVHCAQAFKNGLSYPSVRNIGSKLLAAKSFLLSLVSFNKVFLKSLVHPRERTGLVVVHDILHERVNPHIEEFFEIPVNSNLRGHNFKHQLSRLARNRVSVP